MNFELASARVSAVALQSYLTGDVCGNWYLVRRNEEQIVRMLTATPSVGMGCEQRGSAAVGCYPNPGYWQSAVGPTWACNIEGIAAGNV